MLCAAAAVLFIESTLTTHLSDLDLSTLSVSALFSLLSTTSALMSPVWGRLCDRGVPPKAVLACGAGFVIVVFTFLGPLTFLAVEKSFQLVAGMMALEGKA